jgi:hypothetical protein
VIAVAMEVGLVEEVAALMASSTSWVIKARCCSMLTHLLKLELRHEVRCGIRCGSHSCLAEFLK